MRIRIPIAILFVISVAVAAYLGFGNTSLPHDKLLHFAVFFILTILYYWSIDLPRKRNVNLTLLICALIGGVGSEFAQSTFTERIFDYRDILANVSGSLLATVVSSWYEGRLIDRRRKARYDRLRSNVSGEAEAQQSDPDVPDHMELNNLAPEAEVTAKTGANSAS